MRTKDLLGKEIIFKKEGHTAKAFVADIDDKKGITLHLLNPKKNPWGFTWDSTFEEEGEVFCINLSQAHNINAYNIPPKERYNIAKQMLMKYKVFNTDKYNKVTEKGVCAGGMTPCAFRGVK